MEAAPQRHARQTKASERHQVETPEARREVNEDLSMKIPAGTQVIFCAHADGSGKKLLHWFSIEAPAQTFTLALCEPCDTLFRDTRNLTPGAQVHTLAHDLFPSLPSIQ
jgi:hypothetical protein